MWKLIWSSKYSRGLEKSLFMLNINFVVFGQYLPSISLTCALSCCNHHSTTVKTDIQTLFHTSCPLSPSIIHSSIHPSILSPFLLAVSYCIGQGSLELTILSPLASKALWWQLCTTTGSLSIGLYLWDHEALILPFCTWLIWMSMLPYRLIHSLQVEVLLILRLSSIAL